MAFNRPLEKCANLVSRLRKPRGALHPSAQGPTCRSPGSRNRAGKLCRLRVQAHAHACLPALDILGTDGVNAMIGKSRFFARKVTRQGARRMALLALLALSSAAALAQPGMWGGPGWRLPGGSGWDGPRSSSSRDSLEGRVQVEQFMADGAAAALRQGDVAVSVLAGTTVDAGDQATYEAGVIDQLVKAGYNTLSVAADSGQIAEIRVVRDVVVPEETKRSPVSGSMAVGVSNRGSMTAMAVNVDLTKPKKALISTRLEARLLDRASGQPLWEGRATIVTREGDSQWGEQAISTRLAGALFEKLPTSSHGAS